MDKRAPARKRIRLEGYDYSNVGAYFVTICVKDGHEVLGEVAPVGAIVPDCPLSRTSASCVQLSGVGRIVEGAIEYYNAHVDGFVLDPYIIMPNHVHCIIKIHPQKTGDRGRSPLPYIVRRVKSYVTKRIGYSIWQKSFHDHIIRSEEEYQKISQYIQENPAKWEKDCYYTK